MRFVVSFVSFIVFCCCTMKIVVAQQQQHANVTAVVPTWTPTTTGAQTPTISQQSSQQPIVIPSRMCYTNLTEIAILVSQKNPYILEIYTLCPNTIYEMGYYNRQMTSTPNNDGNDTSIIYQHINGSAPFITRSNSYYQCGSDGSSSNNCIVRGGQFHVINELISYNREDKVNITIKGITFEHSDTAGIILAAPGDITFMDCIFRNYTNIGIFQLLFDDLDARRLLRQPINITGPTEDLIINQLLDYANSIDDTTDQNPKNRLLLGDRKVQSVTVDACLFEYNAMGLDPQVLAKNGMIYVATPDNSLTITDTIFQYNNYSNTIGIDSYAIYVSNGAGLSITNSCFIHNNFTGNGTVLHLGSSEAFVSQSVYGTMDKGDNDFDCAYANVAGIGCVEYDNAVCGASNTFPVREFVSPTSGIYRNDLGWYVTTAVFVVTCLL